MKIAIMDNNFEKQLISFLHTIVKAMGHSDYYVVPGKNFDDLSIEDLYNKLQEILNSCKVLNFYRIEEEHGIDVIIEGVSDNLIKLSSFTNHQLSNLFKPYHYFKQIKLKGLAFRQNVTETEFKRFIQIFLMLPEFSDNSNLSDHDGLHKRLLQAGVLNISLFFDEEVISQPQKLSLQTMMSLTIINRDFKYIQLQKYNQQKKADLHNEIIRNILHPIKDDEILKELIINADLIYRETTFDDEKNIERKILNHLTLEQTQNILQIILNDWDKLEDNRKNISDYKAARQIKRFCDISQLLGKEIIKSKEFKKISLIKLLYARDIITFADLPHEMMQQILVEEWTDSFKTMKELWFEEISETKHLSEGDALIRKLIAIIPTLLKKRELASVFEIISFFKNMIFQGTDADWEKVQFIQSVLQEIVKEEDFFNELKLIYLTSKDDQRINLNKIFNHFKRESIPVLFDILKETDSKTIQKDILNLLLSFRKVTIPYTRKLIADRKQPLFIHKNAMIILGEFGDRRFAYEIEPFLNHEKEKLREIALISLSKIYKQDGIDYYKQALMDKNSSIVLRALILIDSLQIKQLAILKFYGNFLSQPSLQIQENYEKLGIQILKNLGNLPPKLLWNGKQTFEELLWNLLEEANNSPKLSKFFTKKITLSQNFIDSLKNTLKELVEKSRKQH